MTPDPASQADFDLIVIGAGPAGYEGAIRASQLGLRVACVEREPQLGGTCLRVGCIPSKALLESSELYREAQHGFAAHGIRAQVELDLAAMHARRTSIVGGLAKGIEGLFKKNKITRFAGQGVLTAPGAVRVESKEGARELHAKHVLIATGSRVAPLRGVELDGERIVTSTEALAFDEVPRHLVVIGAGAIGLELGSVWSRLGAKVTVLEFMDRILAGTDGEIAAEARKLLEKQGLVFRLGARVTAARVQKGKGVRVECEGQEPIECDRVLLSVGRIPNTEGLGLEALGLELDKRGRIPVDEAWQTKLAGVYAVGDVIAGPMLAHKASEEAVACVERIATGYGHVNYGAIPNVVYTAPEIASVGKTEEELKEAGRAYRKGSFPFLANARARALGQTDGRVKLLADSETDRVLGVHILGPRAGELIAEAVSALEFGASAEDLARTCHAHPTLPEALKEAALAAHGRTLNL